MGERAGERGVNVGLIVFWLLSLLSIPLLSFYGRSLQLSVIDHFPMEELSLYLGVVLSCVALVFLFVLIYSGFDGYIYHLIWVAALSVLLYTYLPIVEKIHVGFFGLFGFLSYRILRLKTAVFVCVAVASLDELFQHVLVTRVGDWRDVWLNIFAVSLGMFLGFLLIADNRGRDTGGCAK